MGLCLSAERPSPDWRDWRKTLSCAKSYKPGYVIAEGCFSQVVAATRLRDGHGVALKILYLQHPCLAYPKHVEALQREAFVLQQLQHPSIVRCSHCEDAVKQDIFIMEEELLQGGNILTELVDEMRAERPGVDEPLLALIARQLLQALEHMHSRSIVHRDLKCENIRFSAPSAAWMPDYSRCRPVIIDFGCAEMITPANRTSLRGCLGSAGYVSPEVIGGKLHTPAMDMFSFGVIMYICLTGNKPMSVREARELSYYQSEAYAYTNMKMDTLWQVASSGACSFVAELLERDPEKRLTASEALQHPWLQCAGATPAPRQRLGALLPAGPKAWHRRIAETLREDELHRCARHYVTAEQVKWAASAAGTGMPPQQAPGAFNKASDVALAPNVGDFVANDGPGVTMTGRLMTAAEVEEMGHAVRESRLRHLRTAPADATSPHMLMLQPRRPVRCQNPRPTVTYMDDIKSEGSEMFSTRDLSSMHDLERMNGTSSPVATDVSSAVSLSKQMFDDGLRSSSAGFSETLGQSTGSFSLEQGPSKQLSFGGKRASRPASYGSQLYRIASDNMNDGPDSDAEEPEDDALADQPAKDSLKSLERAAELHPEVGEVSHPLSPSLERPGTGSADTPLTGNELLAAYQADFRVDSALEHESDARTSAEDSSQQNGAESAGFSALGGDGPEQRGADPVATT